MRDLPVIDFAPVMSRSGRLRILRIEIDQPHSGTWIAVEPWLHLSNEQVKKLFAARGRGQAAKIQAWVERLPKLIEAVRSGNVDQSELEYLRTLLDALIANEEKADVRQRVFNAPAHRKNDARTLWRHIHLLAQKESGDSEAERTVADWWSPDSDAKDTLIKKRVAIQKKPADFVGTGNTKTGAFTKEYVPPVEREFQILMRWAMMMNSGDRVAAARMIANTAAQKRDEK